MDLQSRLTTKSNPDKSSYICITSGPFPFQIVWTLLHLTKHKILTDSDYRLELEYNFRFHTYITLQKHSLIFIIKVIIYLSLFLEQHLKNNTYDIYKSCMYFTWKCDFPSCTFALATKAAQKNLPQWLYISTMYVTAYIVW